MKPKNILTTTTATPITTYTVTANNGNYRPRIEYSRDDLTNDNAKTIAMTLTKAFRNVEVICNETGEVVFTRYISEDWFTPIFSITEVIDLIEDCRND